MDIVQRDEQATATRLMQQNDTNEQANKKRATDGLRVAQQRLSKLDNMLSKLYEDRIAGTVSERNFAMLTQKYQEEQGELESKIAELSSEIESEKQREDNIGKWIKLIKSVASFDELTTGLLNSLIEKIVIHEAVKHEDGTKEQDIEIYYRYVGKID